MSEFSKGDMNLKEVSGNSGEVQERLIFKTNSMITLMTVICQL